MKKTVLAVVLSLPMMLSFNALANSDPYDFSSEKFEGWFVGGEVNSVRFNKLKVDSRDMKVTNVSRGTGLNVIGSFGFSFGNSDFVGNIQERIGFGNASLEGYGERFAERFKEEFSSSLSYMQGYRIANVLMPYAKVSYDITYFNTDERNISSGTAYGVGIGGGLKFSISDNLEMGMEYSRMHLRGKDEIKLKGDNVALNLGYRF